MTGANEDEFAQLLGGIGGEHVSAGLTETYGPIRGAARGGQRILVIDDLWEVVEDFLISERDYATGERARKAELNAEFYFFRIGDVEGCRLDDCVEWIERQPRFDAIYVDGALHNQGTGPELAQKVRAKPGLAYQPVTVITANESFFVEQTTTESETRIIGKFDLKGVAAIRKFVTDLPDLRAHTREMFWAARQRELSTDLDLGEQVEEAVKKLGASLMADHGVCAWYLRELRGGTLDAIGMDDLVYEAGKQLPLTKAPVFQKELLEQKAEEKPWKVINTLTAEQAGARPSMAGDHVIAARVGSTIGGGVTALFTAYRRKTEPPFVESDARNLHHAAVLLRLALTTQRVTERLQALAEAIQRVLSADSSAEIAAELCDFLQEQINQPLEFRGYGTKTTARLFVRGDGRLDRWGETFRKHIGSLTTIRSSSIRITEECVYTRAIEDGTTKTNRDPLEKGKSFINTTDSEIRSYVTVPLGYDGAIIGAINLETTCEDAYRRADIALVEAVARVAAAAMLGHRSQRFVTDLARLTSLAVNPVASEPSDPGSILQRGAAILYQLCGYSDFLLFEKPTEKPEAPWQIVQAWRGNGTSAVKREISTLTTVQQQIDDQWDRSYLRRCLDTGGGKTIFVSREIGDGLSDSGPGKLRTKGRPTRSHVVVLLGDQMNGYTRAVMLLFEHPRPFPENFHETLAAFAVFLDTVYGTSFVEVSRFGKELLAAQIEARAGKVYSQVSHQVGNQLNLITNAIQVGYFNDRDAEQIFRDVTERVNAAVEAFESTKILLRSPRPEPCDLVQLWNEVVKDMMPRIEREGFSIVTSIESISVTTDPNLAKYILFHLLENAIVHGKRDGATSIHFDEDREGTGCVVSDDGPPIGSEIVPRMFEMGVTTKALGGGQGLWLAKQIANDLDGALWFERRQNKNCFIFQLSKQVSE